MADESTPSTDEDDDENVAGADRDEAPLPAVPADGGDAAGGVDDADTEDGDAAGAGESDAAEPGDDEASPGSDEASPRSDGASGGSGEATLGTEGPVAESERAGRAAASAPDEASRPGVPEVPADAEESDASDSSAREAAPPDVRKYERFKKVDGAQYERVNDFLRERTYITAREWAMARLCADFRTETGVEMTKIGENLPELVPFMEDTYTPQAVNQARSAFEEKVTKAGATFLYGAMCDFFTAEELDELMYEVTEVAKFLLEVEGVDLPVEEELEAEDRISGVMREVRSASEALRYEECPHCGEDLRE